VTAYLMQQIQLLASRDEICGQTGLELCWEWQTRKHSSELLALRVISQECPDQLKAANLRINLLDNLAHVHRGDSRGKPSHWYIIQSYNLRKRKECEMPPKPTPKEFEKN
jgi:hypothetical protein